MLVPRELDTEAACTCVLTPIFAISDQELYPEASLKWSKIVMESFPPKYDKLVSNRTFIAVRKVQIVSIFILAWCHTLHLSNWYTTTQNSTEGFSSYGSSEIKLLMK